MSKGRWVTSSNFSLHSPRNDWEETREGEAGEQAAKAEQASETLKGC